MTVASRLSLTCQCLRIHAVLLLAIGRSGAALLRYERLLQLRPFDPHALASRAHLHAQRGSFSEASKSLRLLTQTHPQQSAGWFNLGFALQQLGQHGDAGVAFRRALAIDPRMDRAWYGLALVLMDSRLLEAAADALEKTTTLQPMSPQGWVKLAQVRHALEQHDEAFNIVLHLRQFEPKVAAQLERVLGLTRSASLRSDGVRMTTVNPQPAGHAA